MATVLSEFDTFDFDPKKGNVPIEQLYVDLIGDRDTLSIHLSECVYWDGLKMMRVDSFDTFLREFQKGEIYYSGINLPPKRVYEPDEIRFYYRVSGEMKTLEGLSIYDDESVRSTPKDATQISTHKLSYGNNRSISMSRIGADFAAKYLPSGVTIDEEKISAIRSRIPFKDRYILVVLEGDQNPQYVKASELFVQYTYDGINWTNQELLELDGPKADELYARLNNNQARLMYRGRFVNEIDSQDSKLAEYVPDSVVREELIDYESDMKLTINPSQSGEDYFVSQVPLSTTYSVFLPSTRNVSDEKKPGKTKQEHIYHVSTYMLNNSTGNLVKIMAKGESTPRFVDVEKLFVKHDSDYIQINANGNIHEILLGYVGQPLYFNLNGKMTEIEPLTQDDTVTYEELKTFQSTDSGFTDSSYLLLQTGEYVKETAAIQPISYIRKPENGNVDAYLVERSGETYVIDIDLFNKGKTSPSFIAKNSDGQEIEIPIDSDTKITELMRARDIRMCDVVQTTSTHSQIESARVLDKTNIETFNAQLEETRQEFLESYSHNKYAIDSVYNNRGELVAIDRSNGNRYALTTVRTERSFADDTLEYKALNEKPLVFKVQGDQIVDVSGGPKFDVKKANKSDLKKFTSVFKTLGLLALTPAGMLVAVALPFVAAGAVVAAAAGPGVIAAKNSIIAANKARKKNEFSDKFLIQREKMAKDIEATFRDLYSQCAEVERMGKPTPIAKYMKEYEKLYARIASLGPAKAKVQIKVDKDNSIICTSDNAHLLSIFRTKYKAKLVELNKISLNREKIKEELLSLQQRAKKYSKRAIADVVPKDLQDRIDELTRELALMNQHFDAAKEELKNNYSVLSQEEYGAYPGQEKLFKRAKCFKIASIIRLATNEQLLEFGLSAEQVHLLKSCSFDIDNMTVYYKGEYSLEEILAGNTPKKIKDNKLADFNQLRNALNMLSRVDCVKSNSATVQNAYRDVTKTIEGEIRTFEMDENLEKLEVTSRKVDHVASQVERLSAKYRDLLRLQELENTTSAFDPNTTDPVELLLVREKENLINKYSINQHTTPLERRIARLREEIAALKLDGSRLEKARTRLVNKQKEILTRKDELDERLYYSELENDAYTQMQDELRTIRKSIQEIDTKLSITTNTDERDKLISDKKEMVKSLNLAIDSTKMIEFLYDEIRQINMSIDETFVKMQNVNISLDDETLLTLQMKDSLLQQKRELEEQIKSSQATIARYSKLIASLLNETDVEVLRDIITENAEVLHDTRGFDKRRSNVDVHKKNDPTLSVVKELESRKYDIQVRIRKDDPASKEYEAKIYFFKEKLVSIDVVISNLDKKISDKEGELQKTIDRVNADEDLDNATLVTTDDLLKDTLNELNDQILELNIIANELKKKKEEFDAYTITADYSDRDKKAFERRYEALRQYIERIREKAKQLDGKIRQSTREINKTYTTTELQTVAKNLSDFYTYYMSIKAKKLPKDVLEDEKLKQMADALSISKVKALFNSKEKITVKGFDPKILKEMIKSLNDYRKDRAAAETVDRDSNP